jgi:hypothetical protein
MEKEVTRVVEIALVTLLLLCISLFLGGMVTMLFIIARAVR